MKRLFILLAAVLTTASMMAEDSLPSNYLMPAGSQEKLVVMPPTKADVNFKLYPTQNMYNFLLLDTRNGRIWQEQWNTESNKRFETVLSSKTLTHSTEDEITGRFELYPTTNMYNFILVDQINGNVWQVQWSFKVSERMVLPIY